MTTPETIAIRPSEPDAEPPHGFPLEHPYVEHVWAAAIGPTSTLLLRRAAVLFRAFPDGLEVDAKEFAHSLGLNFNGGNQQQLGKTLKRLDKFGVASWDPETGELLVPTHVRPLTHRMLERLPQSTQAVHASLISSVRSLSPTVSATPPAPRIQGPALSLSIGR